MQIKVHVRKVRSNFDRYCMPAGTARFSPTTIFIFSQILRATFAQRLSSESLVVFTSVVVKQLRIIRAI